MDHAATMRNTYERINAGDIAGFGAFQRGDIAQGKVAGTALLHLRADARGDIGQGERPGPFVEPVIGHGVRP